MELNGTKVPQKGTKVPRDAALRGTRRHSPFVTCLTEISLVVGELAVPFFDTTEEG